MRNNKQRFIFWAVVVLLIIGGVLIIIFSHTTPSNADVPPVSESDWTKGNKDANVVLIEYSDFQCSACAVFHFSIKEIVGEFENHILFVYRHFPLPGHENSTLAAMASEAAGAQGKFWEMKDLIFTNQKDWTSASSEDAVNIFAGYAGDMGINIEQFLKDLNSKEVKKSVEEDFESAVSAKLNYTPTLVLNGKIINNPRSMEEFRSLIRNAIEENT